MPCPTAPCPAPSPPSPKKRAPSFASFLARLTLALLPWLAPSLQAAATGSVVGRVQHAETGNYLFGAQIQVAEPAASGTTTASDEAGAFRLDGLPAGTVTLRVIYSGMPTANVPVTVTAGQVTLTTVRLAPTGSDLVKLDAFKVNVSKEMSAKELALNTQRYASNLKSVIALDDLGFIGDGSIPNALKFLPGIDLEQDFYGNGNAITMSGAPSANVPVTYGGFQMTTSADSTQGPTVAGTIGSNPVPPQRSSQLMSLSLNNVSRIEVNRSTLPDDPGSALAGSINFVPKSAFELSAPQYALSVFAAADRDKVLSSTMSGPWSSSINARFPGTSLSVIVPVSARFGFSVSVNANTVPKAYRSQTENWNANYNAATGTYANTPLNPSHYTSNGRALDNFLSVYKRASVNLTADYKLTEHGSVSAAFTQSYNTLQYGNNTVAWGNSNWVNLATSTLTNQVEINSTSLQPRLLNSHITWQANDANRQFALDYRYHFRGWKITFGNSYGNSRKQTRDADIGTANAVAYNLRPLDTLRFNNIGEWGPESITATKNGIKVTPLDINTFAATGNFTAAVNDPVTGVATNVTSVLPAIRFKPIWVGDHRFESMGSVSKTLEGTVPTTVKAGYNVTNYGRTTSLDPMFGTNGNGFLYVGNLPLSAFVQSGYTTPLLAGYGVPQVLDNQVIGRAYRANPAQFVQVRPGADFQSAAQNDNKLTETILAGYLRLDHALLAGRLRLAYGVRYERTEDKGAGFLFKPTNNQARNAAGQLLSTTGAVFVPGTGQTVRTLFPANSLAAAKATYIPYGQTAKAHYDNLFPSASVSYDLSPNFVGRVSYSQTVGRPDLNNIYPSINLPDPALVASENNVNTQIQMNNTGLRPWESNNVGLSLEYYSPGGRNNVTLRGYRRFVSNAFAQQTLSVAQSANLIQQYGANPADYPGAYLVTKVNLPGTIVTSGLELSGSYSFNRILPDWARGLHLNYSAARSTQTGGGNVGAQFASQNLYLVPYSAGAGLSLTRDRFSVAVKGKWNAKTRLAYQDFAVNPFYDPNTFQYRQAALRVDLDASYHLTKNVSVFANGRDISGFTQILQVYSPTTPEIAKNFRRSVYEPVWTAGVKAKF
jgi:TonB-dependent receptor